MEKRGNVGNKKRGGRESRENKEDEDRYDREFVSLRNFNEIRDLAINLRSSNIMDTETMIKYIERYKIDVNSYLPYIVGGKPQPNRYLPLIYYVCQNSQLKDVYKYLIERGADVMLNCKGIETSKNPELLFLCHDDYLRSLISLGRHLSDECKNMICDKLVLGYVERICQLYKLGEIPQSLIKTVIMKKDLAPRLAETLVIRLYEICKNDDTNFSEIVNGILTKYAKTFEFCLRNGMKVDEDTFRYMVNYYLVEPIEICLKFGIRYDVDLIHHSQYDRNVTAILRQLYNDYRYSKLNEVLLEHLN